jgi:hypothetical protein
MEVNRTIYCCGCEKDKEANLVTGLAIYPHRKDLKDLQFWQCKACLNYVGCHKDSKYIAKPLGVIPTEELRKARGHIHTLIDPLWKEKLINRKHLYNKIGKALGIKFHTADIRTIEEARNVYKVCVNIKNELIKGENNE